MCRCAATLSNLGFVMSCFIAVCPIKTYAFKFLVWKFKNTMPVLAIPRVDRVQLCYTNVKELIPGLNSHLGCTEKFPCVEQSVNWTASCAKPFQIQVFAFLVLIIWDSSNKVKFRFWRTAFFTKFTKSESYHRQWDQKRWSRKSRGHNATLETVAHVSKGVLCPWPHHVANTAATTQTRRATASNGASVTDLWGPHLTGIQRSSPARPTASPSLAHAQTRSRNFS